MVDRIRKTLRRLQPKQQKHLEELVLRITEDNLMGLDVKKLQDRDDLYRVRKGSFRIIFQKVSAEKNIIIAVERRSDTTYTEF